MTGKYAVQDGVNESADDCKTYAPEECIFKTTGVALDLGHQDENLEEGGREGGGRDGGEGEGGMEERGRERWERGGRDE